MSSETSTGPNPSKSTQTILSVVAVLLWLQFFLALSFTWSNGKYYHYGWVVPILVAFCFWRQRQAGAGAPNTESNPGTLGRRFLDARL